MVNKEKTKYMILSRINYNQHNLAMHRMFFKRITTFKYLGVELNLMQMIITIEKSNKELIQLTDVSLL